MTHPDLAEDGGGFGLRRWRAAGAAAIGFLAIVVFQLALASGAPLGHAAWGGAESELPPGLRIASAFSAGFWTLAALTVLGRAGFNIARLPQTFVRWGTWILVGVLALGALLNVASSSNWERFIWGPVVAMLAVACLVVARGDGAGGEQVRTTDGKAST
jgi:hypothetical protein